MKKGFTALKNETWEVYKETFKEKMKASECAFDRIKEAFDVVAQDEARKVSCVQQIMFKSTDYLRRIISPVGGQGGVTMSYLCPNCNSFPLEDYVWWVSGGKQTNWWCAICGEKYDWKQPNRLVVVQTGASKRLRSACGTSRPVRKFGQCAEIAGESARGWRRSPTEHCDEPRLGEQKRSHGRRA